MSGPPCGELSRYLDELRAQRKAEAEAVAAETVVVPDNCMAVTEPVITPRRRLFHDVIIMPMIKPCSKCEWEWKKLDVDEQCPYCAYLRDR